MSETQPSAFDGLGAPPVEMMGFVAPPDSSPSVVTAGLEHTKRHGGGLSVMRWFLVGLCIVIVVVALVVWMVILAPGHPSGGSSGGATDLRSTTAPTWSAPISVSLLTPDYYDLSMENMMIAVSRGRLNETFFGINLAKHRVAWTIPNVDGWGYSGDQTGFVIASSSDLRVIDPMTGKVTAK
ncbi:MAG: hypothetical protein FWD80_01555, partial [Propionibacteriaceae bacterium]|nr:hypothetical protein [Propionibacteriaceae bacterium]